MPTCPIENSEEGDAEWKEYRPRIEPDGRSFQDELVTIKGTRKQLMERLAKLYAEWSPHDWVDKWNTHARHLTCVPPCSASLSLSCRRFRPLAEPCGSLDPPQPKGRRLSAVLMGFRHRRPISASGRGVRAAGVFCCCACRALSL